VELIEMVAYPAPAEETWNCVLCDSLTPIPGRWIFVHLAGEHGLEVELLRAERDGVFLYPPKEEKRPCN
jgi:hypothetical protein